MTALDSLITKSMFGSPMRVVTIETSVFESPTTPVVTLKPRDDTMLKTGSPFGKGLRNCERSWAREASPTERILLLISPLRLPRWKVLPSPSRGKLASTICRSFFTGFFAGVPCDRLLLPPWKEEIEERGVS